jgi:hypothetical protein
MVTMDEYHHEKMMKFLLLSGEKNDYYHRLMTMNGTIDELNKKKEEIIEKCFPRIYTNRSFTLIKIDFLTLLFLFSLRLIIDTITVYIEHIQIKLIILFSYLTQLIKSVFDKAMSQLDSHVHNIKRKEREKMFVTIN